MRIKNFLNNVLNGVVAYIKSARFITSVVYIAVLVLLLTLKWLVADWGALGFDVLFCAISVIGCIEFFNAVKIVPSAQRIVSIAFCASIIPLFVLCEMVPVGGYLPVLILFAIYAIVLVIFSLASFDGSNFNTALLSLGAIVYCGGLSWVFSAVNHSEGSMPLVLLMFLIVMLTDSFAYVTGLSLKRWVPYKLAPKISPNKTIIGAVGGLIGGMVAGIIAYYLWFGINKIEYDSLVLVAFLAIGFVGAIVGQAGDLCESYLKRRCGIKDSGKILPGHGGVLDRFDSMFFVGVLVLISSLFLAI
ncbi:MAG: phosphatidate cytidylyltransferase [Clostridia bacterium]|nr:phosphatidate cytidylyltransferase [Clostridia bacterium]